MPEIKKQIEKSVYGSLPRLVIYFRLRKPCKVIFRPAFRGEEFQKISQHPDNCYFRV